VTWEYALITENLFDFNNSTAVNYINALSYRKLILSVQLDFGSWATNWTSSVLSIL